MPPLHPILVHFPIGLVIVATLLELIGRAIDKPALHRAALVNLVAGTIMGVPTILAGLAAADEVFTTDPAHEIVEVHETLAFITGGLLVLLSLWAILGFKRWGDRAPVLFVIIMVLAMISIGATGYFGGELVYKHGVAVEKTVAQLESRALLSAANGYRCPVHRDVTSANPGLCPKCGIRMIPILNLPTAKDLKKHQEEALHH